MTPGERSGRSYGHEDEAYPPSPYAAYPEVPNYPYPDPAPGHPGTGHPATGHPVTGGPNGAGGHGGSGYGGTGYGGSGYRGTGYGGSGNGSTGYGGSGYAAPDQRGAGYPQPAGGRYPTDGRGAPPPVRPRAPYQPDDDPGWRGTRSVDGGRSASGAGRDGAGRDGAGRGAGGGAGTGGRGRQGDESESGRGRRRRLPLWQELPLLLVIAFCLAVLIRTFLLQAFYIPSGSMEDTLIAGDRVLVNKVVYNFREPARGEVVVFQGTDAWAPLATDDGDVGMLAKVGRTLGDLVGISRPGEKDYIKRVIGLPGDVISCCDVEGRLFVNGEPINEDYVIRDSPLADAQDGVRDCRGRQFDEVVVEPGQMFVLGDHRQRSQDSRCQGQVPIDNIIGRAFIIVWPNDRWAGLSATDTFANVPQPVAAGAADDAVTLAAAGGDPTSGELGLVLPLLLSLGWATSGFGSGFASRSDLIAGTRSARSGLTGRSPGRRLAE